MNQFHEIIQNVSLTEKSAVLADGLNKYVFRVQPSATKVQIKGAVEGLFGKKVVSVNTANYAGKSKRQRTASAGRKAHWKKAIVTLRKGDKIDLA
jgi:large subunit ribosomal protein L23